MKILYVSMDNMSSQKGSTIHIKETIDNLEKRGHSVTLLAQSTAPVNNINRFHRTGSFLHHKSELKQFLGLLGVCFRTSLYILRFRKDNDIIYTRDLFAAVLAILFRKKTKNKVVYEINGIWQEERKLKGNYLLNNLYICLISRIEKMFIGKADKLIAVSKGIKEWLEDNYGFRDNEISVVSNGVNIGLFRPVEDKRILLEQIGNSDIRVTDRIVCYIGRLTFWQGVQYLAEAAPDVVKAVPDTKFLIVGDGWQKQELEQRIAELGVSRNFIFTGLIPYEKVPVYINLADICVAPFTYERNQKTGLSPLKIYSYMACRKPIITSRMPGLEFLEKYDCGILLKPGHIKDLSVSIINLLGDRHRRTELSRNGYLYATRECGWEKTAEKIEKIILK